MSYLHDVCLFTYSGVQQIVCRVFVLFCLASSCVPFFTSFSGLAIRYSLAFI